MDGRRLLDLSMGFGAMLVGHLNPVVVEHVQRALTDIGTLFVTPSPQATEMSERFCRPVRSRHAPVHQLRHRGADVRHPRGARVHRPQGRGEDRGRLPRRVRRPAGLGQARAGGHRPGRRADPARCRSTSRRAPSTSSPYNDLPYLEKILAEHGSDIAVMVIEPVVENLSIVVPDEGYLAGVREACDRHGVVLRLRRGEDRPHCRVRRRRAAPRRPARPDHPRQEHRRRPAAGRVRRQARGHGGRRRRADGPLRHLQRQPAGDGCAAGGRRDLHPRGARRRRGDQRAGDDGHRRGDRRSTSCRRTPSASG